MIRKTPYFSCFGNFWKCFIALGRALFFKGLFILSDLLAPARALYVTMYSMQQTHTLLNSTTTNAQSKVCVCVNKCNIALISLLCWSTPTSSGKIWPGFGEICCGLLQSFLCLKNCFLLCLCFQSFYSPSPSSEMKALWELKAKKYKVLYFQTSA